MTNSELELAQNLAGASHPEQYVLVMQDLLRKLLEERRAAAERADRLERTTRCVNDNALAWHAGEDGKARALNTIAVWTSEALAGRVHPAVDLLAAAVPEEET